jgi:hypothetical protein
MKYALIAFMAIACSGSEEPASEPAKPEAKSEAKTEAPKADAHAGMDHSKMDAGAHIGPVPEGAKVFFVAPADGATVASPVKIQMGVEGMEVKPAGQIQDGSGHHHIIIDADPVAKGTLVPADDNHKHFGKGQTETELNLTPGQHTLQLQFANGVHLSYGEQMSAKITITVE